MREPAPCMRYQLHVPMAVVRGGRRLTRVVVAAAARSRMTSSCCAASRARARVQKSVSSSTVCCEPGLQRTRRPMLGVPAQRGLQPYPRVGQTQGCARPGTPEPRRPPGGRRSLHVRSVTLPLGCSRWTGCFGRRPSAVGRRLCGCRGLRQATGRVACRRTAGPSRGTGPGPWFGWRQQSPECDRGSGGPPPGARPGRSGHRRVLPLRPADAAGPLSAFVHGRKPMVCLDQTRRRRSAHSLRERHPW